MQSTAYRLGDKFNIGSFDFIVRSGLHINRWTTLPVIEKTKTRLEYSLRMGTGFLFYSPNTNIRFDFSYNVFDWGSRAVEFKEELFGERWMISFSISGNK